MAHMIMEHDSMFSARETPWHGLGVVNPDALSAFDALKTAAYVYTENFDSDWDHFQNFLDKEED